MEKALPWVEQKLALALADRQREAVRLAIASKLLVITGGPGVGKTTIVRAILAILGAKRVRVALCAPTGRAAKRLTEITGLEAKTIHRLLEVSPADGRFRRGPASPLDTDLLVVDETSMVDVPLMHALVRAVPPRAAVVFVGDVDQLPSVGPGQVLDDIIGSGAVPVVRLTEVFRQAAASRIIVNAHRVNHGEMPELAASPDSPSDFYFVEIESPEDGLARIIQIVAERIPQRFGLDAVRDVQVLSPMNRGALGARSLNIELQKRLNPRPVQAIQRFGSTFAIGDKVMQIENDYDKDVYNGDIGFVRRIDQDLGDVTVESSTAGRSFTAPTNSTRSSSPTPPPCTRRRAAIPRGGDPGDDAALPDAAAEPDLHGDYARPEAGGTGGTEESARDGRARLARGAPLVEARRLARGAWKMSPPTWYRWAARGPALTSASPSLARAGRGAPAPPPASPKRSPAREVCLAATRPRSA